MTQSIITMRKRKASLYCNRKEINMFLHINFKDGSNPWIRFNLTNKQFEQMKKGWEKNYKLTLIKDIATGEFYEAERKENR